MRPKTQMSGRAVVIALALGLSASGSLLAGGTNCTGCVPLPPATPPTGEVNFYLDGVGAGNVMAGVYTSPYTAVINPTGIVSGSGGTAGTASGGTSIPVICDDFASDSYIDEDWDAIVTNLSSLSSGTVGYLRWGASGGPSAVPLNDTSQAAAVSSNCGGSNNCGLNEGLTQLQAYDAAALLAIDIFNTANATQLDDYSYAMWALFDTSDALKQLSDGCPGSNCAVQTAVEKQAIEYLYAAVAEATTAGNPLSNELKNYNVTIYSYDSQYSPACYPPTTGSGPTTCPSAPPQEFLTVTAVPEGSSLTQFAVYFFLGGAGLLFSGRRRIFGSGN